MISRRADDLRAARLVTGGQEALVTARVLGVPKQTLSTWVGLGDRGEIQGASDRPGGGELAQNGAGVESGRRTEDPQDLVQDLLDMHAEHEP